MARSRKSLGGRHTPRRRRTRTPSPTPRVNGWRQVAYYLTRAGRHRLCRAIGAMRSKLSWSSVIRVAPWALGATLVVVFALCAVRAWHDRRSAAVEDPIVARGRYMVNDVAACTRCHGADLSGGQAFAGTFTQLDTTNLSVGVSGVIHAPNLTPDYRTGLGSWTNQQIFDVFRTGVDKNGHPLQGPMPLSMFSGMSDEDINAIIAYLRTLTPVYHEVPANVISGTIGNPNASQCIHCHESRSILDASPGSEGGLQSRGLYLVNYAAACIDCHTARTQTGA